jgi:hypothetical protein
MSRVSRATRRNPEPRNSSWKAAAVKALTKFHARPAIVTRETIWTQLYIRRFDPSEAAELAKREYESTHPPSWIKRRR